MTTNSEQTGITRRSQPRFRPIAVLSMLYFVLFFFLFGLLLVTPELLSVLETMSPGSEQQAAAQQAVHAIFRPRLPIALVLAMATTAAGGHFKLLPGLRI